MQSYSLEKYKSYINLYLLLDFVKHSDKWYKILDIPYAFQDDTLSVNKLMNSTVYVNQHHTVIYIYAIG